MEELIEARRKVKEIDEKINILLSGILPLLEERAENVKIIAQHKLTTGDTIFKPLQERMVYKERIEDGVKRGIDRDFLTKLFSLIMQWSCSVQNEYIGGRLEELYAKSYGDYKENLLNLCKSVVKNYDKEEHFGTRAARRFEKGILIGMIDSLSDRRGLADLGCATGQIAIDFSSLFEKVYGFDISPDMISYANGKLRDKNNVEFKVVDIEKEIPLDNESISLVVMNLGTGSDIKYIEKVLAEIHRILCDDGRLLISFYNKEALVYNWPFFLGSGMAATILPERNCILVHYGEEVYPVFGKAYTIGEVNRLIENYFKNYDIVTYPTIASITPVDNKSAFPSPNLQSIIERLDKKLAYSGGCQGNYIIVTAEKR